MTFLWYHVGCPSVIRPALLFSFAHTVFVNRWDERFWRQPEITIKTVFIDDNKTSPLIIKEKNKTAWAWHNLINDSHFIPSKALAGDIWKTVSNSGAILSGCWQNLIKLQHRLQHLSLCHQTKNLDPDSLVCRTACESVCGCVCVCIQSYVCEQQWVYILYACVHVGYLA